MWLSFLLLFGSTTTSFLHSFASHDDTVDSRTKQDGPAIENKHHHCSFLGFALAPFANDSQGAVVLVPKTYHFAVYNASYNNVKLQAYNAQHSLRGPPEVA